MKSSTERIFEKINGADPFDSCREFYMDYKPLAERMFEKLNECQGTPVSKQFGTAKWSEENITRPQKEDLKWLFEKASK